MREAIGNSFIVNLLLVFLGVMSIIFLGSISYSKAFKVKNRIITVIEKYGEWPENTLMEMNYPRKEIEASLKQIGYPVARVNPHLTSLGLNTCVTKNGGKLIYGNNPMSDTYHYCIYKYTDDRGVYYGVTTFMHFDIPLIGGLLQFPVYGETKSLYATGVHYNN